MKRRLAGFQKKHRRLLISVSAIIATVLVALVVVSSFFGQGSIVSTEELKEYVEVYLSEYKKILDENSGTIFQTNLTNWNNFTFWEFRRFNTEGVISRDRGAALFFTPTNGDTRITICEITDPVEYYVWPQMTRNIKNLVDVAFSPGLYPLDAPIDLHDHVLLYVEPGATLRYTVPGQGHAFNISAEGAIVILGSLIEEHRTILKGSNRKEDWSMLQARFDALDEFLWDCKGLLNDTVIQSIDAKYRLTLLLEKIASRMNSGKYREEPSLFREDYDDLKMTSPPTETLSKILADYVDMQKSAAPTLPEQTLHFFIQTVIGQMILVTIVGGIILAIIRQKYIERARAQ